jgi:hypothetical protein
MCLLFLWNTWFLDNAIADVLSQKIGVGSFSVCDMSFNNLLSHTDLKIRFAIFQCESLGDSMNLETRLAAYMMSGLVAVRYNKLPTKLLYKVESTVGPSSFLLNFVPKGMGVSYTMINCVGFFKVFFFCVLFVQDLSSVVRSASSVRFLRRIF